MKKLKQKGPPTSARPRLGWTARVLTGLLAIVLALLAGEAIVRLTRSAPGLRPISIASDDDTVYRRSKNPILSYELKSSYRNADPNLRFAYPSTNAHGQRDVERTLEKPAGTRRILLLGDSVVEGHGIREIDDLMSRRLERHFGGGTEVLNFGVSGYCTLAEVELLEVKGLTFEPDAVVLVFVENDFHNFVPEAAKASEIDRPALAKTLFLRSHLARLVFSRFDLFHFGIASDPVRWNREAIGDNNVVVGLDRLRALADRHGFDPLIAIWPRFADDSIDDLGFVSPESNEMIIERLAGDRGIPSLRLSEYFERHRAASGRSTNPRLTYTIGDGLHPSVEGNAVAATALMAAMSGSGDAPAFRVASAGSSGDEGRAVEEARKLGAKRPTYAKSLVNVGESLERAGDLDGALGYYEQAVELEPQNAAAIFNVGAILVKQGQLDRGKSMYERALQIDPDLHLAWKGLGVVAVLNQRFDEAAAHFEHALRLRPRDTEAHYNLGTVYLNTGKLDGAARAFSSTLSIDPDHAAAHNSLGIVYAQRSQFDEAGRHFAEALRLQPGFEDAARNLAQLRSITAER